MDRFKDLLGDRDGYGAGARLARALNVTPDHVSRWKHGRPTPVYLEALAELLEQTPPEQWPERWRLEARS
jgi:hypothetical protein